MFKYKYDLLIEHVAPEKPLAHEQMYPPVDAIEQVPPFWHGNEEHGLVT